MEFWEIENPVSLWRKAWEKKGFKLTKAWYESGASFKQLPPKSDPAYITEYFDHMFNFCWYRSGMPYYKVYPSIIKPLIKINMQGICGNKLLPPNGIENLAIHLPKENCIDPIRTIFISHQPKNKHIVAIGVDIGNRSNDGFPEYLTAYFYKDSVDEVISIIDVALEGLNWTERDCQIYGNALKLVTTLCLIGDSPELIQPEVLNADEHKLKGQHNIEALVAKARRRGKYGFTIGKDIEVMPHYRRPHLALVWYGPGKKKSKIIPRKGSIVHRSKVEKIPTGYGAEE